jgi:hypothetical protein
MDSRHSSCQVDNPLWPRGTAPYSTYSTRLCPTSNSTLLSLLICRVVIFHSFRYTKPASRIPECDQIERCPDPPPELLRMTPGPHDARHDRRCLISGFCSETVHADAHCFGCDVQLLLLPRPLIECYILCGSRDMIHATVTINATTDLT